MKKTWAVMGTAVAVSAMIFTGCGSSNTTTGTDTTQESENTDTAATDTPAAEDSKGGDFSGLISPISREEGSGTRGAFIELFGIETKDTDGNKIDNTTDTAEITNSTSVMMTTVAGNEYAIGYVSLGSLDDSVKALKIDGAEASVDTVKDGSYKISRPFNIVTKDGYNFQFTLYFQPVFKCVFFQIFIFRFASAIAFFHIDHCNTVYDFFFLRT